MNIRLLTLLFLFNFCTSVFSQNNAISSTTVNKSATENESQDIYIKILWLDNTGTLQLNTNYIKTLTDQQRAALGYIATDVSSECNWDGAKKADASNLKCKFLSALNLGYQCSETHLSFLKKWFKEDTKVLDRLQYCNKTESSAKIQDHFIEIKMITTKETIKILYSAVGEDLDKQKTWSWQEESTYSFTKTGIKQINRKNINGEYN
ncbi:DUF674 domain-containing protein [Flavobacterium piscisymbiosum]|uniref:DUF674 domain-containing protein n=1 Tax=Flavobacterium piscisymbiosum TaxID=2893753 RepID=A0ABS8MG93_9FLAO|nr:DUF674 domain-containing protein [Flavobacterium sp. F-30]MCC9063976.1 DUF674 domain-containing protein [Flavobacterium sp. F-30]